MNLTDTERWMMCFFSLSSVSHQLQQWAVLHQASWWLHDQLPQPTGRRQVQVLWRQWWSKDCRHQDQVEVKANPSWLSTCPPFVYNWNSLFYIPDCSSIISLETYSHTECWCCNKRKWPKEGATAHFTAVCLLDISSVTGFVNKCCEKKCRPCVYPNLSPSDAHWYNIPCMISSIDDVCSFNSICNVHDT